MTNKLNVSDSACYGTACNETDIYYLNFAKCCAIFCVCNNSRKANLYFKPLTRDDRVRAQSAAGTDDALTISTYLLCKNAELEDGSKAFAPADAPNLQRELPESVLNEIELFMFDIKLNVDTAKK